jgi:phosphate transport system protein
MVRRGSPAVRPREARSSDVHAAFTDRPLLVTFCAYGVTMREAFHDQLDSIFHDLAEICQSVETSVRLATQALLNGDAEVAEQVIAADEKVDRARERVEDTAFNLLSLQQPVAGDLRVVVSALRIVSELERMGDLSVHVAKIARLRVPEIAVPEAARPMIARMGDVAEDMVRRVAAVITERDVEAAIELGRDDEEMDQLRRSSFTQLLSDDWGHGVEAAVDIALLGRYYERIADHAVSVANRVVFVVTGQYPVATEA